MRATSVSALGYLEIGVSSLADWRSYAQEVLGIGGVSLPDGLGLRYDAHRWRIRLVETGEDDIRCAGFEVSSPVELEAIGAGLDALGFPVRTGTAAQAADRGVAQLLLTQEPFGLPIELYCGDRSAADTFRSPRGVSGFVTGAQGLGHMVIAVGDQAQAERFYMQGLGLRLSDHIVLGPEGRQLTLTFLHCNARHHTLALVPAPGPKRLNHIMLQVATLDDIGHGLDAAQKAGVRISSSLGRHTNDQMVSFYMRSPSGFDVEYGYGGVEVDDATWQPQTHYATSFWGHQSAARAGR